MSSQYYFLLHVADKPGVLHAISGAFAQHQVSIRRVSQEGHGDEAQLVIITHRATERALQHCVEELRHLEAVKNVSSVLRVEGDEP
jgi:homoserine dehydrogenase